MNYIYNIYLNFTRTYYDFYEWSDNDNIISIKKIPIIKINTNDFKNIISNYIKISNKDFNSIKNKTETKNSNYKNCFIVTDSKNVYALNVDNKGYTKELSTFNLDDEYNILEYSKSIKETSIDYKIVNHRNYKLETRYEIYKKNYLLKIINKLPLDTIKYIYYDCFNMTSDNYVLMKDVLIKEIKNNTQKSNQIFNILNLISTN